MSTELERKLNNDMLNYLIPKACQDNHEAKEYLFMISRCARVIDDIVDGDKEVSEKKLYDTFWILTAGLASNAFFRENVDRLWPLQAAAYNAWMDANELQNGTQIARAYAHVLRDYVNELIPFVALLCGGWEHSRAISMETREKLIKEL